MTLSNYYQQMDPFVPAAWSLFYLLIAKERVDHDSRDATGAPGCCPSQIVPRDISGYRGMLGFTMAVEEK
ncbi:MAG: hypothetical protein HN383_14100 [Verrucomicrobia bacterium]|nr:hypothetical protein [Verrucomicrobiota bacterium]